MERFDIEIIQISENEIYVRILEGENKLIETVGSNKDLRLIIDELLEKRI
jgi:hypothetical protein